MSELGKKKPPSGPGNWSHWRRPNTRTYDYNFEYGESYYAPQVRYLASISSSSVESSSQSVSRTSYRSSARSSSRSVTSRTLRARSVPPPALSFIERWTSDPFYGRYGPLPSWRRTESSSSLSAQERASSVSRSIRAASETRETRESSVSRLERSSSVSRSVRASSESRVSKLLAESAAISTTESSVKVQRERRSAAAAAASSRLSAASLRQRVSACASSLEEISALSSNTRSNIREALARATETSALAASSYDAYAKNYPRQHVVCETSCPLHNDPNFQRRFVLGNRFLDAAALGGFDVLYDPTASTKLVTKLRSVNETESEEIHAQRSSSVESSRLRARYQEASW